MGVDPERIRALMKVVVASANPVKLGAAQQAFEAAFPDSTIAVQSVSVASGVGDQPASDAETRRGARTRLHRNPGLRLSRHGLLRRDRLRSRHRRERRRPRIGSPSIQ